MKLGIIVTKLYRIVKFKPELLLEPYITPNTNKRKAAKNKFEEALYKLLISSIYGKICESKRKRGTSERYIRNTVRANKIALSAYDDKRRYILSDGVSILPYSQYRTMNASIFPDNTDSNQDDEEDNDDSERNVIETNSTRHHEDEYIDVWLKFLDERDEIVNWDQENSNQEEIFTQDTNYGSEDSFLVMNTQPS